ncbi:MAG: hypothetical protein AAGC74_05145 [Verrucomicrobiota bacterium]
MNSGFLFGAVGLVVGIVVGFAAGGFSGGGEEGGEVAEVAAKTERPRVVMAKSGVSVANFEEIFLDRSRTERVRKMLDYYGNLGPGEFEAEAEKIQDLPFSERLLANFLLFSQWAEIDPLNALAYSDTMGRGGMFVKPTILQSWAAADPLAASAYFEENPREFGMMAMMGGRGRGGASGAATIAGEWARQDPQAALKWAQSLDGRDGSGAVASVIRQMAVTDPAAAVDMARGLEGDDLASAQRAIARQWASEDWGAMESWLNTLPADEREAAMGEAVRGLAQDDPEGAAEKALMMAEGDARNEGLETAVERWSQENPQQAMDFLLANANEDVQADAMRETMGNLTRTDAEAGLAVINSMTAGEVRDRAVGSFVFANDEGSPEENVSLAATIEDDGSRARAIGVSTIRWMQEDEGAATEFLNTTDLIDDSARERILNRAANGGGRGAGRGPRG